MTKKVKKVCNNEGMSLDARKIKSACIMQKSLHYKTNKLCTNEVRITQRRSKER